MEFTSLNESDNFLTYPTNKVVGIVGSTEDLDAAIKDLNTAGFGQEEVHALCGQKGASRLDVTGAQHGFFARVYRFVEKFGDMESKHLRDYRDELLGGHFLIAVDVDDEDERKRVADILVSHGGHRVNFFGRWAVEKMS